MAGQVTVQLPLLRVNPLKQVVQVVVTLAHCTQFVTAASQLGETQAPATLLKPKAHSLQEVAEVQDLQFVRTELHWTQEPEPSTKKPLRQVVQTALELTTVQASQLLMATEQGEQLGLVTLPRLTSLLPH